MLKGGMTWDGSNTQVEWKRSAKALEHAIGRSALISNENKWYTIFAAQ